MQNTDPDKPDYVPPVPPEKNLRYAVRVAAQYLAISEDTLRDRITAGQVQAISDGRRIFVPGSEIIRLSTLPGSQQ